MQTQNIDLYKSLYVINPNQKTLNWRQFLILNALFLFFIIIFSITQYFQLYLFGFQEKSVEAKRQLLEKTFLTKKRQYPTVFFQRDAENLISNKSQELQIQKRLLTNISNHSSLSNYLNEFTKTSATNTWLTQIAIQNGGNTIKLSGKALNYPAFNTFLTKVNSSIPFQKYQLNIQNVKDNLEKPKGPIEFEVVLQKWPA